MSQTSISTKNTLTVLTGTAGVTFAPAGRDASQVISYRAIVDSAVPAADKVLKTSGSITQKNGQVNGWKSKTTLSVPVMATLVAGDAIGYQAQPKVQDVLSVTVSIFRPSTITNANARAALEEFAYAILAGNSIDTAGAGKLVTAMLGYTPADA